MSSTTTGEAPSNAGVGDFHKFARPDAGARTVEGNTSGARAMRLEKQRAAEQQEYEELKRQKQFDHDNATLNIHAKFQPARIGSVEEQAFKTKTIGLVSAEEFMKATHAKRDRGRKLDDEDDDDEDETEEEKVKRKAIKLAASKKEAKRNKQKKKEKKQRAALLSFQTQDDDEELNDTSKAADENDHGHGNRDSNKKKNTSSALVVSATPANLATIGSCKKDPSIDTSFLPDKEREEAFVAERKRLEKEWKARQIQIKQEHLQITYSYWDGSGHRKSCTITKGDSVSEFLEVVRKELCRDFRELGSVASDALLYVKEDLILPHDITFYDLIATKARGKSGPLFHFDVRDDIRIGPLDVRVEKVCVRRQYICLCIYINVYTVLYILHFACSCLQIFFVCCILPLSHIIFCCIILDCFLMNNFTRDANRPSYISLHCSVHVSPHTHTHTNRMNHIREKWSKGAGTNGISISFQHQDGKCTIQRKITELTR